MSLTIYGTTGLAGIFGDPVSHSLSPAMHNAAHAALRQNRIYVPFHVTTEQLRDALRAVVALGIIGVNLTVPHKEAAARILAGNLSAEARTLGAVNCVVNRHGKLFGDNTDARGLEMALREAGVSRVRRIGIIGAGGGAAAVLLAGSRLGAHQFVVFNRTASRAYRLAKRFPKLDMDIRPLKQLKKRDALSGSELVVNATTVGLKGENFPPIDFDSAPAEALFYDLIYRAEPTPFLKAAAAAGFRTLDGATMLLHQGALAFKLFNRIDAPLEVMREALMRALGR